MVLRFGCLELMEFYGECRRQYGKVFRLWLGFDLVVVFLDAEDIKVSDF